MVSVYGLRFIFRGAGSHVTCFANQEEKADARMKAEPTGVSIMDTVCSFIQKGRVVGNKVAFS